MRKDREQANVLRKSGMSYSEIKVKMGVPKSTLSDWFRGQNWSNNIAIESARKAREGSAIRMMVLNTIRGGRLKKVYEEARQDALVDYEELKYHPLFISGVMAYWAHGDKTAKSLVSLSSSDPKMVNVFRIFLQNICGVKKIKTYLILKKNIDEQFCKMYWIEECGLKYEDFGKSTHICNNINSKIKKINKDYGICKIVLSSAYLKSKMLKWIELMSKEIREEKYLNNFVV
ncbi:MAG: hypothetical protein WC666_02495 [Candidatus Paceibacterota bacterium]|jgi:hypothetical protein